MGGDARVLAERINAWALAEGIERQAELEVVRALGVPLGQGFLLGRPAATWDPRPEEHARRIRSMGKPNGVAESSVGPLVESAPTVSLRDLLAGAAPAAEMAVVVDDDGCPVGHVRPGLPPVLGGRGPLRAIGRPADRRWDPVLCVDAVGRLTGIIRLERLIAKLADDRHEGETT